jgi:hypothetical protein
MVVEDHKVGFAAVSLQREGRDFTDRDEAVLTMFQPHLLQAHRNAADFDSARRQASGMEHMINGCDLGL